MYYICSIVLLLMTLCCIEAITNGGPRPIGGSVNPKPNATIQEVCCSKGWHICCKSYPWSQPSTSQASHEKLMKDTCKNHLKSYQDYGAFGPACINNYELMLDIKVTRNRIYEYHTCYAGKKDFYFINRTLQAVEEMEHPIMACCRKHSAIDNKFNANVGWHIIQIDHVKGWPAVELYDKYLKNIKTPNCAEYGDARQISIKLQTALRNMAKYKKCAAYIACSSDN